MNDDYPPRMKITHPIALAIAILISVLIAAIFIAALWRVLLWIVP